MRNRIGTSFFIQKVDISTAESKPSWQAEWERTLRAAEKEGEVTVAIYDQGPVSVEVVDAFQKSFPKVKLNSLRARGSQIGPKVIAERRAHKYLVAQINQFKEGVSLTSSGRHD